MSASNLSTAKRAQQLYDELNRHLLRHGISNQATAHVCEALEAFLCLVKVKGDELEDMTNRLEAEEQKVHYLRREKDILRRQVKHLRQEVPNLENTSEHYKAKIKAQKAELAELKRTTDQHCEQLVRLSNEVEDARATLQLLQNQQQDVCQTIHNHHATHIERQASLESLLSTTSDTESDFEKTFLTSLEAPGSFEVHSSASSMCRIGSVTFARLEAVSSSMGAEPTTSTFPSSSEVVAPSSSHTVSSSKVNAGEFPSDCASGKDAVVEALYVPTSSHISSSSSDVTSSSSAVSIAAAPTVYWAADYVAGRCTDTDSMGVADVDCVVQVVSSKPDKQQQGTTTFKSLIAKARGMYQRLLVKNSSRRGSDFGAKRSSSSSGGESRRLSCWGSSSGSARSSSCDA